MHARSLLDNLHTIHYINHALTKPYFSLSADKPLLQSYAFCEMHSGGFKVKNAIALTETACIILFRAIDELQFKGKDYIIHVPQCLPGMEKWANNFC